MIENEESIRWSVRAIRWAIGSHKRKDIRFDILDGAMCRGIGRERYIYIYIYTSHTSAIK